MKEASVFNPRFPHWCRIVRKTVEDPLVDEDDFSPLEDEEDDGNDGNDGNDVSDGNDALVIYEGACRSYKVNTTSDKGDVITSQRGLSLPLNQECWDELGVVPQEGDEVIVSHGTTFQEYGRVIDRNVATASYAGTHLIWRYGRT